MPRLGRDCFGLSMQAMELQLVCLRPTPEDSQWKIAAYAPFLALLGFVGVYNHQVLREEFIPSLTQ